MQQHRSESKGSKEGPEFERCITVCVFCVLCSGKPRDPHAEGFRIVETNMIGNWNDAFVAVLQCWICFIDEFKDLDIRVD